MTKVSLGLLKPEQEPHLRSIHSHHPATISIYNYTARKFKAYWIDFEGRRKRCHADVEPHGVFTGRTYSTHPYVLTDENDIPRHLFVAEMGDCIVDLRTEDGTIQEPGQVSLGLLKPEQEPHLRALHSHHPATISIYNYTAKSYKVYWIDFEGQRKRCHADVEPYGVFYGRTYSTHPYVLTDENDFPCQLFVAEMGDCTVNLLPEDDTSQETGQILELISPAVGDEPRSKLEESRATSFIDINNPTDEDYRLIWLDFEGKRREREVLPALSTATHRSFQSHPFLLEGMKSHKSYIFVAKSGRCQVNIPR